MKESIELTNSISDSSETDNQGDKIYTRKPYCSGSIVTQDKGDKIYTRKPYCSGSIVTQDKEDKIYTRKPYCSGSIETQNNTFYDFLQSEYINPKGEVKILKSVKLSTLIEYYKFWCLFNNKKRINCYHSTIISILDSNGYGIFTLKRKNKRTKYVQGISLTKI